ncbi:MAG: hypothetical protein AAF384_15045 [Pseudomonadota bacterium]
MNGPAPNRRLGARDGIGFGWGNQTVFKTGFIYRFNDRITFRMGWNGGSQNVPADQTLLGVLAPASFTNHINGGMTIKLGENTELSWGYMHAFDEEQRDTNSALLGVPATARFAGDALDIGITRRF